SFVFNNSSKYSLTGAAIGVAGDLDYFTSVAKFTGDITITLTPGSALNGTVKAFISRDNVIVQVASAKFTTAGAALSLTFAIAASDEFFIQVSGADSTVGSYDLTVKNEVVSSSTVVIPKAVDSSVINSTAGELSEQFTKAIADAADINSANIDLISQNITQRLVAAFIASMGGALDQAYIIFWCDPLDSFSFSGLGTNVGVSGGSTTNQGSSTSLSTNGALNTVIVSGAQASQYKLNMTGVGNTNSVLAGATMVTASGQIINPTVTGGSSTSGIASSGGVTKTGLQLVLDFGSNSGGGNGGNGGGGNGGNGNGNNGGGGDTAQSGPVAGSTTASTSASASSTSASSTASATTGLITSLAALANAITQSATASGAETGASSLLANLASLALDLGNTTTTLDEKQLAKDLGGDAPAGELDLSSLNTVKTLSDFVTITFAQAYKGFNQAVFSTLDAENQVVSEITNIFDKVLPALVPSEFENAVENLLVQTKKSLLEDGKATLLKTGDILADIIMSKLIKNLPAAQPAKNKVDAKVPSFEFVIANFVQQNKNDSTAEENCFGEHTAITEKIPQCFEEIFNSVNRSALDDSLTGPSILLNDQQNKAAEALGVIAGVLLAPGFLSSTNGTQAPAFEKPKPRKQKS
ncbi:MAG: hypothetical protein NTZ30_06845, partial [Planctomycetota bacterium]|nr:hypothetical protein [Planctomycetota bacterium]